LQARVGVAERIGGRRWTLHLAGGGSIVLPAEGVAEALARWQRLARSAAPRVSAIDLRLPERTLLRVPAGPGQQPVGRMRDGRLAVGGI
jgi:hypothetical protein